jgi:hypothetical protein
MFFAKLDLNEVAFLLAALAILAGFFAQIFSGGSTTDQPVRSPDSSKHDQESK